MNAADAGDVRGKPGNDKMMLGRTSLAALAAMAWALVAPTVLATAVIAGNWQYTVGDLPPQPLVANAAGEVTATFAFAHSATICFERPRETLRPDPAEFHAASLGLAVKRSDYSSHPIHGSLFVKDKDGLWFQGQTDFTLRPDDGWQELRVNLAAAARDLRPVGHEAAWSSLHAASIHTIGLSLYGGEPDLEVTLHCRRPAFVGTRIRPPLHIHDWQFPAQAETQVTLESRFGLSREYFNPFDPDEIKVDVEAVSPSGAMRHWPAFISLDHRRELRVNREMVTPLGPPFWAFRFTPQEAGVHRLRLVIEDNSEEATVRLASPWQRLEVTRSGRPGFVRVCPDDQRYFAHSTGELFYPVGFNLHTVKDVRSEKQLGFGYLPDRGTYSFEEYFDAMAENGVNAVEIWMAAWSLAIEWTSARPGFHGLGRYNLANAWRLDHVLDHARERGIYVHLVLDNHGKLSSHCDPEWAEAPHNRQQAFAVADDAHLERPVDFFSDPRSQRYYRQRNRYIAARWGAQTNIFGIELWSEVDLVTDHKQAYDSGVLAEWHVTAARQLYELTQGPHLVTTHTCGTFQNNLKLRGLFELDEIAYVVGDAYRKDTPFVEHMRKHIEALREFRKPILITEYGGTPHGAGRGRLAADLHAGIWSSLFMEQAGTPFLWWHDFIHRHGQYQHFRGFAQFMADIDPRGKDFVFATAEVRGPGGLPDAERSCLTAGNQDEHYAWIFDRQLMIEYPEDPAAVPELTPLAERAVTISGLGAGTFVAVFFDPLGGEELGRLLATTREGEMLLELPPFRADLAVKIRREHPVGGIHSILTPGTTAP